MPAKPTCAVMVPTVRADLFATFLRTFSATPALAGWRLYPVIQGWSKEELARVQAMSEWGRVTQAVVQDEKEAPYVLRVRTMCLHEDVDVWCNCDDDMEFLPGETDYSEAVARVLEPHTGVVSANWIRSEGFRQRAVFKKGSFVGQAIVNMAGGQLYARKIVRLLAAQPLVPYMFDDVQVGLAAYVAGYDNYRYQGSLPDVDIAVCRDTTETPPEMRRSHLRHVQRTTMLTGLRAAPDGWVLTLEDDALVVRDFLSAVLNITRAPAGEHVVTFLSSRKRYYDAVKSGARWWRCPDAVSSVATLYPARLLSDFLGWSSSYVSPEYPYLDGRIALWCCSRRDPAWVTCPSLVGHRVGPSLLGGAISLGRTFSSFDPDMGDAAGIDWRAGPILDGPPASSIYRDARRWVARPEAAGVGHLL